MSSPQRGPDDELADVELLFDVAEAAFGSYLHHRAPVVFAGVVTGLGSIYLRDTDDGRPIYRVRFRDDHDHGTVYELDIAWATGELEAILDLVERTYGNKASES